MVQLVEMPVEKFDAWNERVWRLYRAELIQSGVSPAAADVNVESNIKATMVDGKPAHGNTVFEVLDRDTIVGVVWLNQKDTEWFIYDIEVYEEFRGKGFGRATMRAIEDHVRALGGTVIELSVFGFNTTAQNLYKSEGYETMRVAMQKKL